MSLTNVATEVLVFEPNGKTVEKKFRNLFPKLLTKEVEEEFGESLGHKVASGLRSMARLDMDMIQLRHGERRVRVKVAA